MNLCNAKGSRIKDQGIKYFIVLLGRFLIPGIGYYCMIATFLSVFWRDEN